MPGASDSVVENAMKTWLRYSKDRRRYQGLEHKAGGGADNDDARSDDDQNDDDGQDHDGQDNDMVREE